jgi:Domain of unknown function (DUF4190)
MTVQGGDARGKAHGQAEQPARSPEIPPPEQASPPAGYPPPGYPPSGPGYPGAPVYDNPSYPCGGYLPPGYEGGYAQQSETNGMAIGSLIASVVGLMVPISSIVGIVLGSVAINQIKKTRQPGYGMAIAGIVIGIATLVTYVVFAIHFRAHLPS